MIKSVVLFFGKIEIMKKFLGILVLGLLWCNAVLAGSLVGTKWEVTSIPIESNNRPYTIEFLKGGECQFKQDETDSDIAILPNFLVCFLSYKTGPVV